MTAAVGAVAGGAARTAAGSTAARGSATKSTAGDLATETVRKKVSAPRAPKATKTRPNRRHRGSQRVLLAEFIVCLLLLGLHPLARPEGEVSAKDWMKRGTAVCFLFIALGMVSSIGPKSQRAAAMFGGLIAIVLLIDQRSAFGVLVKKLNAPPTPPPEGPAASASSGGLTGGGGG